ncbi:hypothetical protein FJZ33_01880 [Candidatus Poribacteria bacterium]|nr:hypothetical protein [Candidatus Poribacteria bacterium]
MSQRELPEIKVDVKLKLPLHKREALKLLSVIERKTIRGTVNFLFLYFVRLFAFIIIEGFILNDG